MTWTDEEAAKAWDACGGAGHGFAGMKRAMTVAVELVAARGGTMMAEDVNRVLNLIGNACGFGGDVHRSFDRILLVAQTRRDRIDVMSALIVELEAEVERLTQSLGNVTLAAEVMSAHVDATAGSNSPKPLDGCIVGSAPADQSHKMSCRPQNREDAKRMRLLSQLACQRYPCSPTCTHDDAKTPGHSERVRQRSEAFEQLVLSKERSADWLLGFENGKDAGSEAMRAACWEAIQPLLTDVGLGSLERERWKAAIEGATP